MRRGSNSLLDGVEVLTLLVEFYVKGAFRETIDFELFNLAVT